MIKVSVSMDTKKYNLDEKKAEKLIADSLASEGVKKGDISIVFGEDESLRKLKVEFFQKDEFTDVIAFRMNEYSEQDVEGEVYISLPRARENARKFEEPFGREVARLIVHGGLHLLNYDDRTEVERKIMREKENHYLNKLGWEGLIRE